jgi:hypothetical protein
LDNAEQLRSAYEWCTGRLANVEIRTEPFPATLEAVDYMRGLNGVKEYPSHYASLDQRRRFTANLVSEIRGEIRTRTTVIAVHQVPGGYVIESVPESSRTHQFDFVQAVVVATGRFGGAALENKSFLSPIPTALSRYEFGIRIESPSSIGFLSRLRAADVKRVWRVGGTEIRTFCTCRDGEIWKVNSAGMSAISGRSDGARSGFSNFGLLARFDARLEESHRIWNAIKVGTRRESPVQWEPLASFLGLVTEQGSRINASTRPWFPNQRFLRGNLRTALGNELHTILTHAVRDLLKWSPDLENEETVCLFPALEGIGCYPELDMSLRISSHRVWCAGDVVGRFRGLIPSLVSGYYAGMSLAEMQQEHASISEATLV